MGEKWEGGDMNYPGGGWKVNLLKQELDKVRQLTWTIRMNLSTPGQPFKSFWIRT
jgi:hypothetical protein